MCTQKTQWFCLHLFFETDTLMLEVSKVLRYIVCVICCTMNNNQTHVEGVEASGTYFNVLIAIYVKCVKSGVCGFYTTLYTEHSVLFIQDPLPLQEGRLPASCSVGLVVHQSKEAASFYLSGTCQITRVVAGKMCSQPPILKTKGTQQPSNSYGCMGN